MLVRPCICLSSQDLTICSPDIWHVKDAAQIVHATQRSQTCRRNHRGAQTRGAGIQTNTWMTRCGSRTSASAVQMAHRHNHILTKETCLTVSRSTCAAFGPSCAGAVQLWKPEERSVPRKDSLLRCFGSWTPSRAIIVWSPRCVLRLGESFVLAVLLRMCFTGSQGCLH
jgi:hypothetical protein